MASSSSPTTKRQRCLSTALPELGCETSEFLPERGMLLRHGTSLQLMSLVTAVLDESQEFGELDPSADWQKWSERRPEFSLYYAALVDPARDGADAVQCVLRAILDGFPEPKQFKRRVRDAIEPQRELGHNDRAAARAADAAAEAAASAPAPSADWEAEEEISRRDARKQAFDIGQPAADASAPKWGDWTRQSGDVDAELAKLMALGRDAAVRKLEGEVDSDP